MGLLIFIFLCSPIFLLIIIIMAVQNGHREKEYNEQINILNKIIDYYSEKYGKLTKRELKKLGIEENETKEFFSDYLKKKSSSIDEDRYNTLMNSSVATWTAEDHNFIYWYRQNQNENNSINKYKEVKSTKLDKKENKSEKVIASKPSKGVAKASSNKRISQKDKNTSFDEYIKKNNITNGNIIFALGILFISAAGLVFATTTWQTIPNIMKIFILLIGALVVLLLSYLAKNKFKLIKTSITLYILFSILLSIIPISLGFFRMLGERLTIGGANEFLLYAISVFVLIIAYTFGIKIYNKKELIKFLPYAINLELLLVILNFTKSYDKILLILSIYNLALMLITKIKSINMSKKVKELLLDSSKYSLIVLSILSISHINAGYTYALINIIFAFLFIFNIIEIDEKEFKISRFIIASIFIVISGLRVDTNFSLEYYSTFFILISFMYLLVKNIDDSKFLYLFYILGFTQLIATGVKFSNTGISMYLVLSMFIMLISISFILKKKKDNILMSFKTIYFLIFSYVLTSFILNSTNANLKFIMLNISIIFLGQIISNILNKTLINDKYTNLGLNVLYRIIFPCIFMYYVYLFYSDVHYAKNIISVYSQLEMNIFTILMNVYVIVYFIINLWTAKLYKNDENVKEYDELNTILYVIMFLTTMLYDSKIYLGLGRLCIEPYHIMAITILLILYYVIVNKKTRISPCIAPILFLVFINKLAYLDNVIRINENERFFVLLIGFIITFVFSEFYKIKNNKIFRNIITILIMIVNIGLITIVDFGSSTNPYLATIFALLVNLLIIYVHYNYDEYKNMASAVLPFTILGFNIYFINSISHTYIYREIISGRLGISNGLIFTSIIYMFVTILSIYREKISYVTKYFNIYILTFLSISMFHYRYRIFRTYEIRLLTIYFTIYVILYLISRINKKNKYVDKFISFIMILQFILMEIEICTEFYVVIDRYFNRSVELFVNIMFIISANFVLWFIFDKLKSKIQSIDKKQIKYLSSIYATGLPKVLYISSIICYLYLVVYFIKYHYQNLNNTIVYFVSMILLVIYMNVLSKKLNYYNFSKVFVLIIPYLLNSYFLYNNEYYTIITLIIFLIYAILAIFNKMDYFRIKLNDVNLSMFAISNFMALMQINEISNILGVKHSIFVIFILLSIFILQFTNTYKNEYYNKQIYSFSLLFFMLAIAMQQFIIIPSEYYPEYISVLICIYVFIIDRVIFRFEKEISDTLWLVTEVIISLFLFIRIISYKLIVNTLIYGIMTFILLIVSYVFKKFKNFMFSAIMLVLLLIYVSRKFWLSIAWWVYLLVVGILLILFATKNEQLKKDNKTMKMLFDDRINNIKKWIEE